MSTKITGYRELDQDTIDLINKVKLHGQVMQELVEEIKLHNLHLRQRAAGVDLGRLNAAEPERWVALGRTHLQEGLMCLTRAVAQPGHF